MAKRKTPKVKDLRPSTITEKELGAIKGIGMNIARLQGEVGALETEKHSVLHMIANLQQELGKQRKQLKETYGTDNINMADGKILYNDGFNDDKAN